MEVRIVKTGSYYAVEKKYWLGWFVTGGNEFEAANQCLSLEEAKKIVNEMKNVKQVVYQETIQG